MTMWSDGINIVCPKCGKPAGEPCWLEGFTPFIHWARVDEGKKLHPEPKPEEVRPA